MEGVVETKHTDNKELPTGWRWVKLGEIAKWGSGGTPTSTNSKYYMGDIPWLIIGDLNDGYINSSEKRITKLGLDNSSAKLVQPESVLVAMYGSIGKLGINKIPVATNQAIAFTEKLNENIYNKYLFHYLFHIRSKLHSLGKGGTQKNISQSVLKMVDFPVPAKQVQHAIVSKIEELLSELDKGKQQLEIAQQQLKIYRQAVLKWAFEGKLTNENVKEGELPEGWNIDKIKNVCLNIKVGIVVKPTNFYSKNNHGIRAFRSANVREFRVNDQDWVYFSEEANELNKRTQIKAGDVLLVRSGYPGTSCVVPKSYEGCNAIDILIATPDNSKILPDFLCSFNNSPLGKGHFVGKSRGVAQKHLNVGEYSNLSIAYPSIEEQHKINQELASKLTVCDKIEDTIATSLAQAETLRQSILKKAFEGKLI